MTLTDFLLQRIAEDEAAARKIHDGIAWRVDGKRIVAIFTTMKYPRWTGSDSVIFVPDRKALGEPPYVRPGERWARVVKCSLEHAHGSCPVDHIARHDPARVLAECEAKRRIVELHYDGAGNLYGPDTHFCAVCTSADGLDDPGWPCPTLRALALPYADHPDYDEAWRP